MVNSLADLSVYDLLGSEMHIDAHLCHDGELKIEIVDIYNETTYVEKMHPMAWQAIVNLAHEILSIERFFNHLRSKKT